MTVEFPSPAFFQALQRRMTEGVERFRRLGYVDVTFGLRVTGDAERCFILAFEVFECTAIREVRSFDGEAVDFVLEGDLEGWREMFENIREHGHADAEHTINTLTHFGEKISVIYDDPDGHDKLYRFVESIQAFLDLAAGLDIRYLPARTGATA